MDKNYVGGKLEPCGDFWCRGGWVITSNTHGGETWDLCFTCEQIRIRNEAPPQPDEDRRIIDPSYPF